MARTKKHTSIFVNPAGIIEQHYVGAQNGRTVGSGVGQAHKLVDKAIKNKQTPLVLVDLTKVTSTNIGAHRAAVKGMQKVPFEKIAAYGPSSLQILINTLAVVSDRKNKVRAFDNRFDALEWLQGRGKS